jgi:chemotaxis protein methyltransferase CheR
MPYPAGCGLDGANTGGSAFFRTPAVWWYLADEFLPGWHARMSRKTGADTGATASARPLRIWSAAAGTGEETWSLAMICLEFQRRHPSFRFVIEGTDSSPLALQTAHAGAYRGRTVERFAALRPALFRRYLEGGPERYTVTQELRDHVGFAPHDLLQAPPSLGRYDLVMLRNVLVDFDEAQQGRVLAQVRKGMRPGAKLVLGEQESITRLDSAFAFEQAHVYHIDEAAP